MRFGSFYAAPEGIWRGPQWNPMYSDRVSVGQVLLNRLLDHPLNVGQVCHDDGHEMTNAQIAQYVVRVALQFQDLGLREGDVVGIAARNSKYLAPVAIAALTMGTPINAVDPIFERDDVAHMFSITRPKIVFCDMANYEEVRRGLQQIPLTPQVFIFSETGDNLPAGTKNVKDLLTPHNGERFFSPPAISDATVLPAAIVCSSGTTGPSKGVSLTHSMVCYQIFQNFNDQPSADRESFFSFSSLYWLTGLITLIGTTYQNMVRVITTKPFTGDLLVAIIKKHRLTSVLTPPMQLATVLNGPLNGADLDSVNTWLCGGAHVPEENCRRMNGLLRNGCMTIAYGCSEIGGLASKTSTNYDSVGPLARGISLKIVDDNGRHLGPGERGEICLKTCIPLRGYFNNGKATEESLKDGWFHTGDIGFMSEEGDLHVVDRKKDIMKVGNYQVDPSEIEKVVERIPGVFLVSVFGIPDPILTDAPAALVVKSAGVQLSEEEVVKFVERNLSPHKWLKGGVHFVDKLPTTPSGKVMKRKCKEFFVNYGAN